jgi:signal transduction histidine kinase
MSGIRVSEKKEPESFLKDFLNNTLREIMTILNAECGSLFIFDPAHKELVLDSFYNSLDLRIEGLRTRIGEGVSGKVGDLKRPVLVKDIDQDIRFSRNGYKHYHTKSFISIPLLLSLEENLIGLINIADKTNGQPFNEKDFEFAVTLSKYACAVADYLCRYSQLSKDKEELNKQNAILNKYASVGKLAAGVVHEINNPLDGIIRYTNILINQIHIEDDTVTREYLLEVKNGLSRIANITKSLLEFSHVVNSFPSQIKKYVDIHKVIDESLDLVQHKINGGIQINRRYDESMPRVLDLGIQHVIINIIKNAIDAMHNGGKLEISTAVNDSTVEISLTDTGLGIPNEIQERIFEPFFTTKGIDKGTGLGLAICQEIINKYEGNIRVRSLCGAGSTFIVSIPNKYLENA